MIVLGIDPGTANTGYGIIETEGNSFSEQPKNKNFFSCLSYGLIKTDSSWEAPDRLKKLNNDLSKLIKTYKPEILIIERLYFFRNLKTAIPVSQACGVVMLTAAKNGLPVRSFTPLEVKLTIAGHGWAEKELVQKKVKSLLKLKNAFKSDDAADALAIAITYCMKET